MSNPCISNKKSTETKSLANQIQSPLFTTHDVYIVVYLHISYKTFILLIRTQHLTIIHTTIIIIINSRLLLFHIGNIIANIYRRRTIRARGYEYLKKLTEPLYTILCSVCNYVYMPKCQQIIILLCMHTFIRQRCVMLLFANFIANVFVLIFWTFAVPSTGRPLALISFLVGLEIAFVCFNIAKKSQRKNCFIEKEQNTKNI